MIRQDKEKVMRGTPASRAREVAEYSRRITDNIFAGSDHKAYRSYRSKKEVEREHYGQLLARSLGEYAKLLERGWRWR
jgi:hypothetical protein